MKIAPYPVSKLRFGDPLGDPIQFSHLLETAQKSRQRELVSIDKIYQSTGAQAVESPRAERANCLRRVDDAAE